MGIQVQEQQVPVHKTKQLVATDSFDPKLEMISVDDEYVYGISQSIKYQDQRATMKTMRAPANHSTIDGTDDTYLEVSGKLFESHKKPRIQSTKYQIALLALFQQHERQADLSGNA
jgi:hypothetical protein